MYVETSGSATSNNQYTKPVFKRNLSYLPAVHPKEANPKTLHTMGLSKF